jgi:GST-like protein
MIDLYTWTTPNGRKVSIALEELGLPYRVVPVNIGRDEQFKPEFLAVSPNNRIPAIVDCDNGGFALMESGAILLYLAEKTGRLLARDSVGRMRTIEWLMWQMGGVGPMIGQAHHFLRAKPGVSEYAAKRYRDEALRLYGVLDRRLEGRDYVVDDYSIADIAIWPWISRFEWHQVDMREFANVRRWYERIAERPAVQRGYQVPAYTTPVPMPAG